MELPDFALLRDKEAPPHSLPTITHDPNPLRVPVPASSRSIGRGSRNDAPLPIPDASVQGQEDEDLENIQLSKHQDQLQDSLHGIRKGASFSIEDLYTNTPIPCWSEQITARGLVVSVIVGAMFSITIHKLMLTVGVIPIVNIAAGLLGYFLVKTWSGFASKLGLWSRPFTRQENTIIQTCIVSCAGIAFSGGYGLYLTGMDEKTYEVVGSKYPGNRAIDVKNPSLGWMIAFLFLISFQGILVLVPLRKVMIISCKLIYPSGTATAALINSFHTSKGTIIAKKQVSCLLRCFFISFLWSFFKWFFSGAGDTLCGFDNFPSFGLTAFANKFYFDFSLPYIGTGMICPHIVNCSVMLGAIVSWGLMWPLIRNRAGDWYPAGLQSTSFEGLFGYQVFFSIAIILGEGLYNFAKIWIVIILSKRARSTAGSPSLPSAEEKKRNDAFSKDGIPLWIALFGYVALSLVCVFVVPLLFPSLRWYQILVCYMIAPVLAFSNAYGAGMTDWNWATAYGNLGLIIFAAWTGKEGGVMAGLAACGLMITIVCTASDLMQDFRTGYLTMSSPRSMFAAQIIGAAMGCILAPTTFWMFWKAFDVGNPSGKYKAPFAIVYREMAITGVEGFSVLPKHCQQFSMALFGASITICFIKDVIPHRISRFIPIPMAMAIPFYIGAYFAVDMFVGSVIVYVWGRRNRRSSEVYVPAVASGFICGDGVWTMPAAMLAAVGRISPPICMMFVPSSSPSP